MHFIVLFEDNPDADADIRQTHMAAHLAFLEANATKVSAAGPLADPVRRRRRRTVAGRDGQLSRDRAARQGRSDRSAQILVDPRLDPGICRWRAADPAGVTGRYST